MTYELDLGIYASAWIAITGTFILMAKWLREKMAALYSDYIGSVDKMNGKLGLDRSVDAADIARDYLLPVGGGAIDAYTSRNDYPRNVYISELDADVGRPISLIVFVLIFVIAILLAFSGPVVYYFWGTSFAAEYLVMLYAIVGTNLLAYLVL